MKKAIILIATVICLSASAQRFDATVSAGLNLGQIDGDASSGYSHPGLRAGVGTSFAVGDDLRSPWRMVVELAFTNKGATLKDQYTYSASYIEVPIMLSYNMMDSKLRLAAGVAPALRVGAYVSEGGFEATNSGDYFERFDLLPLTFSLRYLFGTHLGAEVRFQYSALDVMEGMAGGTYFILRDNKGCFHNLITFGLTYTL